MRKPLFLSILLLSLFGLSAEAAPVLDQDFAPADPDGYAVLGPLTRAQTFTVGMEGLLSRFEVLVSASDRDSRLFEIHPTVAGVPVFGSTALASAVVTYGGNEDPTFYGANISSFSILVSPGDVLAIVDAGQGSDSSAAWWIGSSHGNHYADGEFYTTVYTGSPIVISSTYSPQTGSDLGFRTYIDNSGPACIPAPGALLLLGIGLVCTASRRLR